MHLIVAALRHPWTVIVAILAIVLASFLAIGPAVFQQYGLPYPAGLPKGMEVDIFPSLNLPVIYVCQPYGGMDPAQMEGFLTNYYEYHFLYISGIDHVESRNVQGTALMKLYFHPGTDMAQAMAETINYVNRSQAFMPPGTVSPFVMRFDTGSVPVGYLVLSSETRTIAEIQDIALFRVRPMFSSLPGVSAPPPFGGSARTIVITVDPRRLQSYGMSPDEVIAAVTKGNTLSPSGNVPVGDRYPIVPVNSVVKDPSQLLTIPVRMGERPVYLRDLGYVEDSADAPAGYALVNGRRAVYILATKRSDASTLSVINSIKKALPSMKEAMGKDGQDIDVRFELDQSPYVTRAVAGVVYEGLLGASLVGLMVLLFLRDWRSALIVVLNIPLALLSSILALWITGATINLMTLGGLALAIGILVDEATVEMENIHAQMRRTPSVAQAVRWGNSQTYLPRLLAMLCILAVFMPALFMRGPAQALFAPLALAVGFAMIASYILSSTFVPVISVWLLKGHRASTTTGLSSSSTSDTSGASDMSSATNTSGSRPDSPDADRASRREPDVCGHGAHGPTVFDRLRGAYEKTLTGFVACRWILIPAYLAASVAIIVFVGSRLGREIFPVVDASQFRLRLRAPDGTHINRSERVALDVLDLIEKEVGRDNVQLTLGYVGMIHSNYPINAVYQWSRGPEETILYVDLKESAGINGEELKERLRQRLAEQLPAVRCSFEPSDIVNEVMSFGSPTPVEIAVSGPKLAESRAHAEKIRQELMKIPALRDVQYGQSLEYPTIEIHVDREKAGLAGLTPVDVSRALVTATSSSRFVVPNYWADPKSGIAYQVQVEIPRPVVRQPDGVETIGSEEDLESIPLKRVNEGQVLVRDVADVRTGAMPGQLDRYNMKRQVTLTANIAGTDLGSIAAKVAAAVQRAGDPPSGAKVELRGQIPPMNELISGLTVGLIVAVIVVFLMLTANFQSLRLALVAISSVPAVLAGVLLMLWFTNTTLNIQSFVGAIMAIGVAMANAILLVTFAEHERRSGAAARQAAVIGASSRLRAILMTSCAMIAGMLPMALAVGHAGQQNAPLGRAVVGGLMAATFATLFVLPSMFALLLGWGKATSPSLDPEDPESPHFVPPGGASA